METIYRNIIQYYEKNPVDVLMIIHIIFAVIIYFKGGGKKIFKWPFDVDFVAFEYFFSVSLFIIIGKIIGCL